MDPLIKQIGIVNVKFGEQVTIVHPCNIYIAIIGNHVFVGPFVGILKNVTIGYDCFIEHGVIIINDFFTDGSPAGSDQLKWKPTRLGNRISISSNAIILPVKVCDQVVIGANAEVTKDIVEPGIYVGNLAHIQKGND